MKSQQNKWDHEDDLKVLNPTQPKRNCKIVVFRCMMNDMCRPEEPVMVREVEQPSPSNRLHAAS